MINGKDISTDGYWSNQSLSLATNGYWYVEVVIKEKNKIPRFIQIDNSFNKKENKKEDNILNNEEQEIIFILKSFLLCR